MNNKIITPMGEITILIDDVETQYMSLKGAPIENLCPDVLGRYQIEIHLLPDGKEHTISCVFPYNKSIKGYGESGENLECQGFYDNNCIKLSIGLEGEASIYTDYDYDVEYLDNGMQYVVLPETQTQKYVFGISWIDNIDIDIQSEEMIARDTQPWFGADPTLCIE